MLGWVILKLFQQQNILQKLKPIFGILKKFGVLV
jgi:hypothetical protein